MSIFREVTNKLSHFFGRSGFDNSLDEELRVHMEERADELTAKGLPAREALAQARREFGSSARIAEDSRAAWRFHWLDDLTRDMRYAVRALSRDRGFAITAILSLGLGIGVN